MPVPIQQPMLASTGEASGALSPALEAAKKKAATPQVSPAAQASSAAAGAAAPQPRAAALPQLTFAQMQQQGMARPMPPGAFGDLRQSQPGATTPLIEQMRAAYAKEGPGYMDNQMGRPNPGGAGVPLPAMYPMGGGLPTMPGAPVGTQAPAMPAPQIPTPAIPQVSAGGGIPGLGQAIMQLMNTGPRDISGDYEKMAGRIDDEYALKTKSLEGDMARRGLADSSIRGGNLADLNTSQRNAKSDVLSELASGAEREAIQNKLAALGLATQYDASSAGRQLDAAKINADIALRQGDQGLARDELGLKRDLGYGELGLKREDLGLSRDRLGFDREMGTAELGLKRDDLGLRRDIFGADQARDARDYDLRREDFEASKGFRSRELDQRDSEFAYGKERDLNDYMLRVLQMLGGGEVTDYDLGSLGTTNVNRGY